MTVRDNPNIPGLPRMGTELLEAILLDQFFTVIASELVAFFPVTPSSPANKPL